MITLLGENISLVRPSKIPKPLTFGAWRKRRALRTITNNLTLEEKRAIAAQMGLEFKPKEVRHGE
jgi:hypothetical protein